MDTWTYEYFDGADNAYILKKGSFLYEPMTPERSSSGFYSGGERIEKPLADDDFKQLLSLFEQAMNSKKEHIKDRLMDSGMLRIKDTKDNFILAPESEIKQKIEVFLQALKKQ